MQLYSPQRPLVDVAEVFLWLMAVGTILCASYWSAWSAREEAHEQEKLLKVIQSYISDSPLGLYKSRLEINFLHQPRIKLFSTFL